MIDDLQSIPPGGSLECDLCILGAGPAGLSLAREFIGTAHRVVLLESGGFRVEAGSQALNEAEVIGLPMDGHTAGRARAFGGAARLWAGQCLPMSPLDFERRSWVPFSGWPVSAAELDPYYRRAEAFFRVSGEGYGHEIYRRFGLSAPSWGDDALTSMFTVYTPEVDTGRFSARAFQAAANIRVLLHAHAASIEADPVRGRATAATVRGRDGADRTVRAGAFVLCGGGLENARILLSSRDQRPAGLGNDLDLVGRFYQDHPNAHTATLQGGGLPLQDVFRMLYRGGRRYFPKFLLSPAVQRAEQVLNGNAHLVFDYPDSSGTAALQRLVRALRQRARPDNLMQDVARIAVDIPSLAASLERRLRGRSPKARPSAVHLHCYLEQAPNPESRVFLSEKRGDLGLPQLKIDWRLGTLEQRTLIVLTETVKREFDRLGLGRIQPHDWIREPGDGWKQRMSDQYHHIGTTRMAYSAEQGVVDRDGKVFGVGGLYVGGSSVFPTSGFANPTLTIVALTIRLADHLKEQLGSPRPTARSTGASVSLQAAEGP